MTTNRIFGPFLPSVADFLRLHAIAPSPVVDAQLVVDDRVVPHVGSSPHAVLLAQHQAQVLVEHLPCQRRGRAGRGKKHEGEGQVGRMNVSSHVSPGSIHC